MTIQPRWSTRQVPATWQVKLCVRLPPPRSRIVRIPLDLRGKRGSDRLRNLPEFTQPGSDVTGP